MFQPWRLKLREAEELFQRGQLDQAGRLLQQGNLGEFLPAKQLLTKIATELAHRAGRRVEGGQSSAGWRDLETAQALGADGTQVMELKQQFIERRLAEAEAYLDAGEPAAAAARLEELGQRGAENRQVRLLREVASQMLSAQRLSRQGEFSQAEEILASAGRLAPHLTTLEEMRKACAIKASEVRKLSDALHQALVASEWREALAKAEGILQMCPDHEPARDARRRAWAAAGMKMPAAQTSAARTAPAEHKPPWRGLAAWREQARRRREQAEVADMNQSPTPNDQLSPSAEAMQLANSRFLLWVDGVGGYLVCQGKEILLGQPIRSEHVDVPILADISSRHARIRRDGEHYLLDPLRPARIDGVNVQGASILKDGNIIELGQGVRIRFRRTHPLSASAKLEFVSHHRTQPTADAVLLLAESLVLGPSENCHVHCTQWNRELVLFLQSGGLHCRTQGRFEVDGALVSERSRLTGSSRVVGEDFSLSLETL